MAGLVLLGGSLPALFTMTEVVLSPKFEFGGVAVVWTLGLFFFTPCFLIVGLYSRFLHVHAHDGPSFVLSRIYEFDSSPVAVDSMDWFSSRIDSCG